MNWVLVLIVTGAIALILLVTQVLRIRVTDDQVLNAIDADMWIDGIQVYNRLRSRHGLPFLGILMKGDVYLALKRLSERKAIDLRFQAAAGDDEHQLYWTSVRRLDQTVSS